ncbi:hypothetical protein D2E80_22235 [Mycobacteroides abscessus]|nr:hypothetical protein D2E80_22235 [Mycobacteroides abscessus]SKT79120.1 Uncharacterised protein [Mycobacteroides abscessus subsp. massiliense]SKU02768.1 Uncharacterised protein [Mycobacteroides abscessus subsp. massiliense]
MKLLGAVQSAVNRGVAAIRRGAVALRPGWTRLSRFLSFMAKHPAALAFALIAGRGALAVIDGTFARMHEPGASAVSATGVLSAGAIGSPKTYQQAITGWLQWNGYFEDHFGQAGLSPKFLMVWYVAVDIALIALPVAGLLFAAILYARQRVTNHPRAAALLPVLGWAMFATGVYFLADCAEDISLLSMVWSQVVTLGAVAFAGWMSLAKWVFLGLAVLGCVVGLVAGAQLGRPMTEAVWWRVLLALRLQVVLAAVLLAFLALGGDLARQLDDAFMLLFEKPALLIATLVSAALATFALRGTAGLSLAAYRTVPEQPRKHTMLINRVVLAVGVVAFGVGIAALLGDWWFGQVLAVPGAIAALLALPATVGQMGAITQRDLREAVILKGESIELAGRWAATLALAPLAVLIAMSLRNMIRLLTAHEAVLALVVGGVLVLLLGVAVWIKGRPIDPPRDDPSWAIPSLAMGSGLMFLVLTVETQRAGEFLGAWGVLFMLAVAVTLGLTAMLLFGDAAYPGNVLAACGFRRLPVIAIVVVSCVITSVVDDQSVYHATRLKPDTTATPPGLETVGDALTAWRAVQDPNRQTVPLVFVASAGGGIRAAYWTSLVLNCIVADAAAFEPPPGFDANDKDMCTHDRVMPAKSIFLASGISGGSLGLAVTQAVRDHNAWPTPLGRDFLSAAIAGMAFRDVPNALLRISKPNGDRAAVLEKAWEKAVGEVHGDLEAGFLETARPNGTDHVFPLLALSGTSVADGCRVTVSALRLSGMGAPDKSPSQDCLSLDSIVSPMAPRAQQLPALAGTKDAFERTCPATGEQTATDLRLSTAALLSARFPYVSPTGTLNWCKERGVRTFDLDGGVVDASAAGPLELVWPEVLRWIAEQKSPKQKPPGQKPSEVCFAPKLILIDNGYAAMSGATAPGRPPELTAPLTAVGAVRDAQSSQARQAAALAFEKMFPLGGCSPRVNDPGADWVVPNVVDFHPIEYPGVEAPLGWTLSKLSQESLGRQLRNKYNRCSAAIVAQWFNNTTSRPRGCVA